MLGYKSFHTLLLCYFALGSYAQQYYPQFYDVEVQRTDASVYKMPLVGGLNNPQLSEVDLNNDGIKDLVAFDRTGGVILPFLNGGTANTIDYSYAKEHQDNFPSLRRWVLLRDYNCDGIEDIFTYSNDPSLGRTGIKVYKASRNANQALEYSLVLDFLQYSLNTNIDDIYVSNIDIPAIDDIDGDGDLDILTFEGGGGYVEYFENQSQDLGYSCDSLIFELKDDCWGRFYESGISEIIDLSMDIDSCASKTGWNPLKTSLHAGSALLTIDMNNDNDKELFLGDVSFDNITMLTNAGTKDTAHMTNQDVFFPAMDPIAVDIFPAAYHLDINNDGAKDFLVTPSSETNSINDSVIHFYQNRQDDDFPSFEYENDYFLGSEIIDLGQNAAPTFVDYDGDGLMDIVVGNWGKYLSLGNYESSLYFYKNIGTATNPVFQLMDTDIAGMKIYDIRRYAPTFGDLDADGDFDIMLGQDDGTLIYLENKGSATAPSYPNARFNYELIDVGLSSTPQLVDIDRDGLLDLVIGERNGNFNYHKNIGTAQVADFSDVANSTSFGLIDTKTPGWFEGNSSSCFVDMQGEYKMFVGNTEGQIWHYDQIDNNLSGAFNQIQDGMTNMDEGEQSIMSVADINQDGFLELVVGNKRGGISLYTLDTNFVANTVNVENSLATNVRLYPNPSNTGQLNISFENGYNTSNLDFNIFNALGQRFESIQTFSYIDHATISLDISSLHSGIYYVQIIHDKESTTIAFRVE